MWTPHSQGQARGIRFQKIKPILEEGYSSTSAFGDGKCRCCFFFGFPLSQCEDKIQHSRMVIIYYAKDRRGKDGTALQKRRRREPPPRG